MKTNHSSIESEVDQAILDIAQAASLMPRGKTISGGHFPEAKTKLMALIVDSRKVTGDTSDGYHTFNELYEYRMLYNALLFNELYRHHQNYNVHKSWHHSDGERAFGGGWFVVVAQLPTGQVTNHYEEKDWPLFDIEERVRADKWDGHTPQEAAERLRVFAEMNGA